MSNRVVIDDVEWVLVAVDAPERSEVSAWRLDADGGLSRVFSLRPRVLFPPATTESLLGMSSWYRAPVGIDLAAALEGVTIFATHEDLRVATPPVVSSLGEPQVASRAFPWSRDAEG